MTSTQDLSSSVGAHLQDAVEAPPEALQQELSEATAHHTRCFKLLSLLCWVQKYIQVGRIPRLLQQLDVHNAWSQLIQAMTLCFKLGENDSLAAELLILIIQQSARAGAAGLRVNHQQNQDATATAGSALCGAAGVLTAGAAGAHDTSSQTQQHSINTTAAGHPSCAANPPVCTALPHQMTQHPVELELLTGAVLTATMARLTYCQACPLSPYRLYALTEPLATQAGRTAVGQICRAMLEPQYAAHHEEEIRSGQTALGHASVAMHLLTLSSLLLRLYGPRVPASAFILWPTCRMLQCKLASMLGPLTDSLVSCSQSLAAARRSAAGQHGWEVQQYAAVKRRRRLVKLFLNQVLQCLRATLGSDVGWEGVLGAVPGSWQQVRQGQQQPVVEVAGAVATLMPLVSLVRRPAFKGSTVTHALDCLALITFQLRPAAVAPLACTQVPSFPGTTPTAGDWQGGGSCNATATGNLMQHVLSILKEHEPDLEMLRAALSLLANILDVLHTSQEQPAAGQPPAGASIAVPDPHALLATALQEAGYLSCDTFHCITERLKHQLASTQFHTQPSQADTCPDAWSRYEHSQLLLQQCLRLAEHVSAALSVMKQEQQEQQQRRQRQQGAILDLSQPLQLVQPSTHTPENTAHTQQQVQGYAPATLLPTEHGMQKQRSPHVNITLPGETSGVPQQPGQASAPAAVPLTHNQQLLSICVSSQVQQTPGPQECQVTAGLPPLACKLDTETLDACGAQPRVAAVSLTEANQTSQPYAAPLQTVGHSAPAAPLQLAAGPCTPSTPAAPLKAVAVPQTPLPCAAAIDTPPPTPPASQARPWPKSSPQSMSGRPSLLTARRLAAAVPAHHSAAAQGEWSGRLTAKQVAEASDGSGSGQPSVMAAKADSEQEHQTGGAAGADEVVPPIAPKPQDTCAPVMAHPDARRLITHIAPRMQLAARGQPRKRSLKELYGSDNTGPPVTDATIPRQTMMRTTCAQLETPTYEETAPIGNIPSIHPAADSDPALTSGTGLGDPALLAAAAASLPVSQLPAVSSRHPSTPPSISRDIAAAEAALALSCEPLQATHGPLSPVSSPSKLSGGHVDLLVATAEQGKPSTHHNTILGPGTHLFAVHGAEEGRDGANLDLLPAPHPQLQGCVQLDPQLVPSTPARKPTLKGQSTPAWVYKPAGSSATFCKALKKRRYTVDQVSVTGSLMTPDDPSSRSAVPAAGIAVCNSYGGANAATQHAGPPAGCSSGAHGLPAWGTPAQAAVTAAAPGAAGPLASTPATTSAIALAGTNGNGAYGAGSRTAYIAEEASKAPPHIVSMPASAAPAPTSSGEHRRTPFRSLHWCPATSDADIQSAGAAGRIMPVGSAAEHGLPGALQGHQATGQPVQPDSSIAARMSCPSMEDSQQHQSMQEEGNRPLSDMQMTQQAGGGGVEQFIKPEPGCSRPLPSLQVAQAVQVPQQLSSQPQASSHINDSGPEAASSHHSPAGHEQPAPLPAIGTAVLEPSIAHLAAAAGQLHHQSTQEPWGGLSCYELWSVCAYAVQGVVQQVCGGTPPSPGGLDACLAAVQLHGFLVRLAAGWWADPGAALEWLAAGFTQLSSAVPAVGWALEAGQAVRCSGSRDDSVHPELDSDTITATLPGGTSRTGDSAPHLSPSQLQHSLHRLSDALQQAGAGEHAIGELLSSVQGQLDTERACASRCSAALHQGIMSEKTVDDGISSGTNHSLDGIPVTTAGCLAHTLPCKPCLSGRCHQQLMIAIAGAEGLGLLGVGHACLIDWAYMAMGV